MNHSRRAFLTLAAAPPARPRFGQEIQPVAPLSDDEVYHLLNRITWGPRPEELLRARASGYEAYLDEQLNPDALEDNEAEAALARLPLLSLDRRALYTLQGGEYRAYKALARGMIARAVLSRRQLYERVVEFWCDHFNIPASDGDFAREVVVFQRDVIRRHALGRFRELLADVSASPAMLYYLDNFANVAEHPNENFARELLELYTLGVDGGYTEQDVKEVARAFTGWTVHDRAPDGFYFDAGQHDPGEKYVLGHVLPAGRGIEDGLHVLSILANHPATARFLAEKLCRRFVNDAPPASLVSSTAGVWQSSGGDIKTVLRHLLLSPEFRASAGQKFRRPLDFLVAALRATGANVDRWWILDEILTDLGQPPYGWLPPNGYPDAAGSWINTGGLLARWNTAMLLTHEAMSAQDARGYGVRADLFARTGPAATVGELVDAVAIQIFGTPLPEPQRQEFVAYAGGDPDAPATNHLRATKLASLYGLMLASPYFQWR